MRNCQFGTPEFLGVIADSITGCTFLIHSLYVIYRESGYEEFYNAALDTYRYALTEFPSRRADVDKILTAFGEQ